MKKINISNANKRDAILGFEAKPTRAKVTQVLKDGTAKNNVKLLKTTPETDMSTLAAQYEDLEDLSQAIIKDDVDIDIEIIGKKVEGLKKIYVDENNKIVFNIKMIEVIKDKDGVEQKREALVSKAANISIENLPIKWSGKLMPKAAAIKKFAFAKHYQIRHVNGLTYDFLYDMAKELSDKDGLMFVGGGEKGNEPLVVTTGGTPYRGFLEGRIKDDKYMLILHLTNLELKEFNV
ncbi:hypothetical protein [Sulfurimonas sp.]|jgi:hypothetical protein|uniref:hypothetical protein n=1 Tax=Sulfurimonas sp. TaxID=2022749 RepID=UPI0025D21562|nr:hypothetical protein [Sulfurimonas sp.]MBT5934864.1 hypothetical protein [Sulfurimonas sp.]